MQAGGRGGLDIIVWCCLVGAGFFFCVTVRAQAPVNIRELQASAQQMLKSENAAGALSAPAKADPKSAVYEDQIGFLLAATKRVADAVPHLRRATELDPRLAEAWYHLGVALWLVQQPGGAISALRRAVALAPENAAYRFRLGSACNDTGPGRRRSKDMFIRLLQPHPLARAGGPVRVCVGQGNGGGYNTDDDA